MPTTPYQHQFVFPATSPRTYETLHLDGREAQSFEGPANIAVAQVAEFEAREPGGPMLENWEFTAGSRNPNEVRGVEEEIAQTLVDDLFLLEVSPWDTAQSQSMPHHAYPHLLTAPPHDQSQQDYSSSSIVSPTQPQSGPHHPFPQVLTVPRHDQSRQDYPSSSIVSPVQRNNYVPLRSSQPLQNPLQCSSVSSDSEPVSSEEVHLKRLRNTAASARFRAKKKLREKIIERSAQQKREKLAELEAKVFRLETENKWLKNLITRKYDTDNSEMLDNSVKLSKEVQIRDTKEVLTDDKP